VNSVSLPAPVAGLRVQATAWWRGLARRERLGASAALFVVGAVLVWLVGVQPALRTLREAPVTLDRLDLELQRMQLLAAESRALRATPPVAPTQAASALKAATERLGDKARIAIQGERATLTLIGLNGDALRSWLAEARSAARVRPVEAQLQRTPQGYSGSLVLSLGGVP